ncbi:helix-turn-helix domain-containing protein [Streptomyces sp. NPDC000877]|uniref:winged helix-turn-helix transcriptional regulator n=1 Tax=unclassified Streptomyces TaxID=2593676 RepID=UPI0033187522
MSRTAMRTPDLDWTDPDCPVARTLDLVGDRWSLLVVRDAMDGARSFTEFQRRTGIARNILTDRLRKLTAHGLLAQRTAPSGRRQEYVLTDAGRALFPVILTLRQWGERHAFAPGEAHSVLVDQHGTPVPEVAPTGSDGTLLDADTTQVRKVR